MKANRTHQVVLIGATLAVSWFAMMGVHEAGHVLGAVATGGVVQRVVLHPLTISRTDVAPNPHPLIVVWAGPFFGVAAPLAGWGIAILLRAPFWYLLRFLAGFCLIANGAYLGVGSFEQVGDAGELLRHGAALWQLWFFGALCLPAGFWLWHGLGPHFGFGQNEGNVSIPTTYSLLALLCVGMVLMIALGGE